MRWQRRPPAAATAPPPARLFAALRPGNALRGPAGAARSDPPIQISESPVELISLFMDFVLHVDQHLAAFVQDHGAWVYALLFRIVFVETGVVVMPFLPGDSLLFVAGALCGLGLMSFAPTCGVLLAAAVLGDQCNYSIGRFIGPKVFQWGRFALVQPARVRRSPCVLRKVRRHHDRAGAISAVHSHLCPVRRRRGRNDAQQIHRLQRGGCADLGVRPVYRGLLPGLDSLGQGEPRQDRRLGDDSDSRLFVLAGALKARLKRSTTV